MLPRPWTEREKNPKQLKKLGRLGKNKIHVRKYILNYPSQGKSIVFVMNPSLSGCWENQLYNSHNKEPRKDLNKYLK